MMRKSTRGPAQRSIAPAPKESATVFVAAVLEQAHAMGLLSAGTRHVGARLPTRLVEQAKKQTGIASTKVLLTFALANVALEDDFAAAFVAAGGTIDPDLDIGF